MKGASEATVRIALRDTGLSLFVYKPPDDARNWKPADFLVWWQTQRAAASAWLEVKDTKAVRGFPWRELRPSQVNGIVAARKIGVPYWLVIHWAATHDWTISDAAGVLGWFQNESKASIPRVLLQTRFGVQCEGRLLAATLKLALLGEL